METKIYDGTEAVFGRIASTVAKDLLKGYSVDLINCEEIIVSGDKKKFVEKIMQKRRMGNGASMKGPKYPKVADRLVKRMIRGMLPWDRQKGRDAFKNLKCYVGDGGLKEDDLKNAIKVEHKKPMKFSKIKDVMRLLE